MVNVNKIISILEAFAPSELAEQWDNSGWQINLGTNEAVNVMLCLSVTQNVIEQAIKQKCNLIIAHHPLFFNEFKTISADNVSQKILVEAVKHEIQIYSAHTNLDKAKGGVNDVLIKSLGVKNVKVVNDYVRTGSYPKGISLDDFILKLKLSLNTQNIRLINPNNIQTIKTVGVCSGSGSEFINTADVDVFVTGDIKYHSAIEVRNKVVIDAGHFETERIVLPIIKNLIEKEAPNAIIARENSPFITA
ncbi:MAG: Nif3-like dinuclear metal center hexameric protein [bacterium]|nr:Nif3-like dinuclear metal center hexameric protein [bacterium]